MIGRDLDSQHLLEQAHSLAASARRSTSFLVSYFRNWAIASLILGFALFCLPLLDSPEYLLVCLILWLLFQVGLVVFYYRGRTTRPRTGPAMALGIVGGTVPWPVFAGWPAVARSDVWWIQGSGWLAAGLISCACLIGASTLAKRQTR